MQHARTPLQLKTLPIEFNYACDVQQTTQKLSFILMGGRKLGAFEKSRATQVRRSAGCTSLV
jgi:sulfur transfer protein SufE